MTSRQAPRRKVAPSLLSSITVLALAAWIHPAFSATGTDARSDPPMDAPTMSIAVGGTIALGIIGHGTTTATDERVLDEAGADPDANTPSYAADPRDDVTLQRIFDDARARQPGLSEPQEIGDLSAPLALDKSENVDDTAAAVDTDPADSSAELPGFSPDELSRYRQQMYRTDI